MFIDFCGFGEVLLGDLGRKKLRKSLKAPLLEFPEGDESLAPFSLDSEFPFSWEGGGWTKNWRREGVCSLGDASDIFVFVLASVRF